MGIPAAAAGWRRRRSVAMHTLPDAENTTMENRSSGPQNSVQRLWRSLQVWQIASRVQTCFQPRLCSSQAFQFPQENPGNATTKGNDDAAASAAQGITVASTKPNNCFFLFATPNRKEEEEAKLKIIAKFLSQIETRIVRSRHIRRSRRRRWWWWNGGQCWQCYWREHIYDKELSSFHLCECNAKSNKICKNGGNSRTIAAAEETRGRELQQTECRGARWSREVVVTLLIWLVHCQEIRERLERQKRDSRHSRDIWKLWKEKVLLVRLEKHSRDWKDKREKCYRLNINWRDIWERKNAFCSHPSAVRQTWTILQCPQILYRFYKLCSSFISTHHCCPNWADFLIHIGDQTTRMMIMFERVNDGSNNLMESVMNFACVFGVVLQMSSSTFTRFISFCIGVCKKIYIIISREKGL